MEKTMVKVFAAMAWTIPILFSHPAFAEPDDSCPTSTNRFGIQAEPPQPPFEASLNSSYLPPSGAKVGGTKPGDSDAFALGFNVRGNMPIDEHWRWSLGLGSQNLFLGSIAGAPIPERVNTLNLNAGGGYKFDERWMVNAFCGPMLYRFENVSGDSVGFSGGVVATYHASAALTWTLGVMIAPDSDVVAMPVGGVSWLINDRFTLELGMPKTRLSYRADSKWTFYTGLDMVGTVFRTDENFGSNIGSLRYNNTLATYWDIRLGAGVSYEITKKLHAEIEAGGSVYRRIDYSDIDQHVEFDPAPYVRLGLNLRF